MSPYFVVFESAPNGPGNQPHRVVAGEVEEGFVAGEGQTVIRAENLAEARAKMGPCPACTEGLKIIKRSRFLEGL